METILVLVLFSVLFVAGAALVGGAVAKILFDFVTAPLREDSEA